MKGGGDIKIEISLTDPTLFGNETAEDEREDVFNSYVLERADLGTFYDSTTRFAIARAYKGEGKSALLRLTQQKVRKHKDKPIIVSRTAAELSPEISREDYSSWVRAWKAAILGMFASEIGAQIGIAWSDDAMSLVEEAEKTGIRSRSVISSILKRLGLDIEIAGVKAGLPEIKTLGAADQGELVRRWVSGKGQLWLFVDDVDKNFKNMDSDRLRVASFFDACRELINRVPELHVRTAIRPNVWTIIRREYESLSHVNQYAVDLNWTEAQVRSLLARRVQAFLKRTAQWSKVEKALRGSSEDHDKQVISLVFEESMRWGGGHRPAHVILYTLSKHRPRWVIELAKVAATGALRRDHKLITHEDVVSELLAFGRRRIEDTVAEFKSQCPQIDELISAFGREKEQLSTGELLRIMENKILSHVTPIISGVTGRPTARQVAALLFEIGLYYGRRENKDGTYTHISYSDQPTLLLSRTNIDDGLSWEIHPAFRQALEMRDASGGEHKPTR